MSGFVIRATSLDDDEKIRWVSPERQSCMWKLSKARSDAAVLPTEKAANELANGSSNLPSVMNDKSAKAKFA